MLHLFLDVIKLKLIYIDR